MDLPTPERYKFATKPNKKWTKPKDPLDTVMMILLVVVALAILGCYFGYASTIIPVFVFFVGLAWFKAPARSFPTAEVRFTSERDKARERQHHHACTLDAIVKEERS